MIKFIKGVRDFAYTLLDIIVTLISALQNYSHFLLYDAHLRKVETLKKSRELLETNAELDSIIREEAEKTRDALKKDTKKFMLIAFPIIILIIIF